MPQVINQPAACHHSPLSEETGLEVCPQCVDVNLCCFLKQRGCETTHKVTCPRAAVGKMENELTSILTVSHVPYVEMYSSACFVAVWQFLRMNLTKPVRNVSCPKHFLLKDNKECFRTIISFCIALHFLDDAVVVLNN